ncbi:glycoside hydrolase family 18 protein [Sphaerisporangium album]|nr:glycoside hydrolase family 18 protein [Sphaerisporangium album]
MTFLSRISGPSRADAPRPRAGGSPFTRRRSRLMAALAAAAIALGLAVVPATAALAANILPNPGFESGLNGWTCASTARTVTTPVHGGTSALEATPAGSDYARCSQSVKVKPSSSYTLSAWVRGNYVFLGALGTGTTDVSTWGSPGAAWSQLTTSFTTGSATTSVTVYVNGWYGTGAYNADDLVLDGPDGGGTPPTPPATPAGLTVTGKTATSVSLSWSASSGATSYNMYQDGTKVGTPSGTTFTATGLASGTTYRFSVSASNTAGESARSAEVTATPSSTPVPPPVPGGLAVTGTSATSVSLSWSASSGATSYNVYQDGTKVGTPSGTTFTATGLTSGTTYRFSVSASNANGESARSAEVTATPGNQPPTSLPKRVLVGYLHASFANGSGYIRMSDVPDAWDVIDLAFGEPTSVTSGDIRFTRCPVAECPNVESEADFIAGIRAKQTAGKKVLISIGGQNGQVQLTTTAARDKFVSSVGAIIDKYGLDGLDIDFEGHSLSLNSGDTDFKNPTTPVVVNLISALRTLKAKYGSRFVLTMAPETFFVQLGYQFYGGGSSGADPRAGAYLPVIYAMRNDLTLLHVQDYNSGPITGLDNQYHTMGSSDFHIAMTDMLLAGFPVAGNTANVFPALRPDQVAIGLPAAVYAGNGFTSVAEVQKAFDCLAKGANCGPYRPRGVYPALRGLMTWSINWDKYNASEFSTNHRRYLNALP